MTINMQVHSPLRLIYNPYNPAVNYPRGQVRYRIQNADPQGRMYVGLIFPGPPGGTTVNVRVDIVPLLARAAEAWNNALSEQGISAQTLHISRTENYLQENIPITLDVSSIAGLITHNPGDIAVGLPVNDPRFLSPEAEADSTFRGAGIYFYNNIIIPPAMISQLEQRNVFPTSSSRNDRAQMIMYSTILHEFGHILGLMHPQPCRRTYCVRRNSHYDTEHSLLPRQLIYLDLADSQRQTAPIMIASEYEYLVRLRQSIGRPLTINDIGITATEANAIRQIINGCYTENINMRDSRAGNDSCHSFSKQWKKVFPQAIKTMTSITNIFHAEL